MEKGNDNAQGRNNHPLSSYRAQVVTPYEREDLQHSATFVARLTMTCRTNLLHHAVKQPSHSVVAFFLYRHTLRRILLEGDYLSLDIAWRTLRHLSYLRIGARLEVRLCLSD